MALYKDGQLVHFIPRYQIENRDASQIAEHLVGVFNEYCGERAEASPQAGS
jgi:putative YphP/YqiW family bacilliredoxin